MQLVASEFVSCWWIIVHPIPTLPSPTPFLSALKASFRAVYPELNMNSIQQQDYGAGPVQGQGNHEDSNKRKGDDGPDPHPRSKRSRYISIAWLVLASRPQACRVILTCRSNECKRRKIKCNGQTPCQRCGNMSLECVYTPNCCTSNFKDSE